MNSMIEDQGERMKNQALDAQAFAALCNELKDVGLHNQLWDATVAHDAAKFKAGLEKGLDVNYKYSDWNGMTVLHKSSYEGLTDITQQILLHHEGLRRVVVLDAPDMDGCTSLFRACQMGHLDVVKLLLEAGASPASTDNDGTTPLHAAATFGAVDICKILHEKGASMTTCDSNEYSAMHCAASNGRVEVIRFLRSVGASAAIADIDGLTPLHVSAAQGHLCVVQFLIEDGADLWAVDSEGNTALDLAKSDLYDDVVAVLEREMKRQKSELDSTKDKEGASIFTTAAKTAVIGTVPTV